ncbi:MAG: flagellar biosynthesis protein FliQ [Proteobacteria bacterium]|nr:flagellar biosynthesis protein FliQ [Pseudomonadota bacterium]
MSAGDILQVTREALYLVVLVSAPAVAASLIVGLVVSVLQATTQVQDQTLSFVPKLLAVMVALAVAGGWMGAQILRLTQALWSQFPAVR